MRKIDFLRTAFFAQVRSEFDYMRKHLQEEDAQLYWITAGRFMGAISALAEFANEVDIISAEEAQRIIEVSEKLTFRS